MRFLMAVLLGLFTLAGGLAPLPAQDKYVKRYGVELNLDKYPQKTPQETFGSVLKALEAGRIPYLMAHLADPAYVDAKVKEYKSTLGPAGDEKSKDLVAFDRLVQEIQQHFRDEPTLVKDLQRFAKEGEWEVADDKASAKIKSLPGRRVFMRNLNDRWFLENRQQ